MEKSTVTIFKPYEFRTGERIRIEGGSRGGDWEVLEVTEKNVRLRCPVSGKEVDWARFCYRVEKREQPWPLRD